MTHTKNDTQGCSNTFLPWLHPCVPDSIPDPLVLLEDNSPHACDAVESLLLDPERSYFWCESLNAFRAAVSNTKIDPSADLESDFKAPDGDGMFAKPDAGFVKLIELIQEKGIVPAVKNGEIDTNQLRSLLLDADAVLIAHFAISASAASPATYWHKRAEEYFKPDHVGLKSWVMALLTRLRSKLAAVEAMPGNTVRQTFEALARKPGLAYLALLVFFSFGAAVPPTVKMVWDRIVRDKGLFDNFIEWSPPDEPIVAAPDGTIRISGRGDPELLASIEFTFDPPLPDQPSIPPRVITKGHEPFTLPFKIPRDGIVRKVTIRLQPRKEPGAPDPGVFTELKEKMTCVRYVVGDLRGSPRLYSEYSGPFLNVRWLKSEPRQVECTWGNLSKRPMELALWSWDGMQAYWRTDIHQSYGTAKFAIAEGHREFIVAPYSAVRSEVTEVEFKAGKAVQIEHSAVVVRQDIPEADQD